MLESQIQVFISCVEEDQETALWLYHDLKRAGVKPWMSSEDMPAGANVKAEMYSAFRSSRYFLPIISNNSFSQKGMAQRELKMGWDLYDECPSSDIFLIPVALDKSTEMDYRLKDFKPADFSQSYENGLKQILKVFLSSQIIGREHLSSLLRILSDIHDIDFLKNVYTESLPSGHVSQTHPETPFEMICRLCDFEKPQPVLTFVEKISEKYASEELKKWKKQVMQTCGLQYSPPEVREDWQMMIRIEEYPVLKKRKKVYMLERFYRSSEGKWLTPDQWYPPEHLSRERKAQVKDKALYCFQEYLEEIIQNEIESLPPEMGKRLKSVDFYLPAEMLGLHAERFKFGEDLLGEEYKVTVRLLERLKNKSVSKAARFIGRWEENWNTFFQRNGGADSAHVCWQKDHHNYSPDNLYRELKISKNCLMMTFMPNTDSNRGGLAHTLFKAGIPVALICRKEDCDEEYHRNIEKEIREMISDNMLHHLPHSLWKQRNSRGSSSEHHYTLVWDDPGCLPPVDYFEAP